MSRRSITACVLALALLAVSGRVAFAQHQLPAGWVRNWDGSNTYVFLGSPGTGNVGYRPGSFDILQAEYSRRHPGWYEQLVGQISRRPADVGGGAYAQDQLPAGWIRNWDGSNTYVFLGSPGTGNVGYRPGSVDILQEEYSRRHPGWYEQLVGQISRRPADVGGGAYAQDQLPAGWIRNWDGSNTYVFLGSPGAGDVGYRPGSFDIPQAEYSRQHPGWYEQLVPQISRDWYHHNQSRAGGGWQDRLSPDQEQHLRPGQRLDSGLRQRAHPLPADLSQRYRPAPSGYRYVVIGGHVLLLDNNYRVREAYQLDLQER